MDALCHQVIKHNILNATNRDVYACDGWNELMAYFGKLVIFIC